MKKYTKRLLKALSMAFCLVATPVFAKPQEDRWPGLQDETHYVMGNDGHVFHEQKADLKVQPASTVKLMTLYLLMEAIEKGEIDLDDKIVMSPKAANISLAYMQAGLGQYQQFDVDFALKSMFVYSANDVASSVGAHLSKISVDEKWSEDNFTNLMNEKAKSFGMHDTVFKDASGISRKSLTTAKDMMILSQKFVENFPQLFDKDSSFTDYPSLKKARRGKGYKKSTNNLVSKETFNDKVDGINYSFRVDGLKTGFTGQAGFCLLVSSEATLQDGSSYRVFVTYFGGSHPKIRNERIVDLLKNAYRDQIQKIENRPKEVSIALNL